MRNCSDKEIARLQNSLLLIRRAGGWSAEEFGNMIGVTKQTISNLENKKTVMTKTQYIAIRAVLDYEIAERSDDTKLSSTVDLCLNSNSLPEEDLKKAQAFVEGATKTGLDKASMVGGLAALIGIAAAEALLLHKSSSSLTSVTENWIAKILKETK